MFSYFDITYSSPTGNPHDNFAVAARQVGLESESEAVGHLPREISRWSALFLEHGGTIEGSVTGARRYSRVAGGMEIPCHLTFAGKKKHVDKLRTLINNLNSVVVYVLE